MGKVQRGQVQLIQRSLGAAGPDVATESVAASQSRRLGTKPDQRIHKVHERLNQRENSEVLTCTNLQLRLLSVHTKYSLNRGVPVSGRHGDTGHIGFRRNPVLAQWDPMGLDRSLDCPVSVSD